MNYVIDLVHPFYMLSKWEVVRELDSLEEQLD